MTVSSEIETAYFIPESEALKAFIDPQLNARRIAYLSNFAVKLASDSWEQGGGKGRIAGFSEDRGELYSVELIVAFPRRLTKIFSRLVGKEPSAVVSFTKYRTKK